MSWLKTASASFFGAIGMPTAVSEAVMEERTEDIRAMMLNTLGEKGAASFSALRRRLMFASDLQGLWYLRSEWMGAISSLYGEREAAKELSKLNIQFEGMLSKGMESRPSPLSSKRR
jgi:hypothetical protein